jgi:predicted alpha/beta-hydrolase family hydrolase
MNPRAFRSRPRPAEVQVSPVQIPLGPVVLAGDLMLPTAAHSIVLFVHGSGSSRHSPRNRFVAQKLNDAGVGTLLFDLLTDQEEEDDARDGHLRFDIPLLAGRLEQATAWVSAHGPTHHRRIGYFGASTGGGAALMAAANLGSTIGAVVSRGGRPDLAGEALPRVVSPTLLIVGERDDVVLRLNEEARTKLRCEAKLVVVRGASHLFEEPGALPHVATLAAEWFQVQLRLQ